MSDHAIHWPAIIHHAGDDELEYIADQQGWNFWHPSHGKSRLIDTAGRIYTITSHRKLQAEGTSLSLDEILALVRAHAMLEGICCTTKIGAANIHAAITLVASLEQK
ncbi:DUF4144 domain-containing protein [Methylobacillus caricis]|uniref:DUF4144 domain-containing protein n=1 Tax=Methylobacillus caricis TaxID=1971611 RepID=UPI001CFF9B3F|nr:DUF4144 domain-containing protein [Methylobacillus caricis]MCB5186823.1 DUF4144 domain-containing protein [Methylobacillus caricis]